MGGAYESFVTALFVCTTSLNQDIAGYFYSSIFSMMISSIFLGVTT